jgi:predicted porin
MKKTLVALAALASVSAFAQTTVTLSGNMDVAGASISGTQYGQKGTSFTTTTGTASTSVINLIAVEDIGGGTTITAKYGLDPRTLTNDSLGTTNNAYQTTSYNAQSTTVTGLARDEAFIGIAGSFGSLKLGAPNAIGLDAHSASSLLGTGIGGGYGIATGYMYQSVVTTRYSRSARYDSPVMNGLKVSAVYAPGNDEVAVTGTGVANYVARSLPNNRQVTELGLSYSNGPLNVQFANIATAAQTNVTGWYAVTANSTGQTTTYGYVATKMNVLGANYNLGSTILSYGLNNGQSNASTTSILQSSGTRMGVKQSFGVIDVTAQFTQLKSTTTAAVSTTAKVTGLRGDYNLSKTAIAYLGYENWDAGTTAAATDTVSGNRKVTSIGLRKTF